MNTAFHNTVNYKSAQYYELLRHFDNGCSNYSKLKTFQFFQNVTNESNYIIDMPIGLMKIELKTKLQICNRNDEILITFTLYLGKMNVDDFSLFK